MMPPAPLKGLDEPKQIICSVCEQGLQDHMTAIKHYRAVHGYALQQAIEAAKSAGPSGQ